MAVAAGPGSDGVSSRGRGNSRGALGAPVPISGFRTMKPAVSALRRLLLVVSHLGASATAVGQGIPLFRRRAAAAASGTVLTQVVPAPPPGDVGANTFPDLPPVSALLGSASETLKNVNAKAAILEARAAQGHLAIEARLARQKAVFEQRLKKTAAENAKLATEVHSVAAENDMLRMRADELMKGNDQMRTELHLLQSRLGAAQIFIQGSLRSSDDSQVRELDVVRPRHLQPPHGTFATNAEALRHRRIGGGRNTTNVDHHSATTLKSVSVKAAGAHHPDESHVANTTADHQEETDDSDDSDDDDDDDDEKTGRPSNPGPAFVQVSEDASRMVSENVLGIESQVGQMADIEALVSGVHGDKMTTTNPVDLLRMLSENVANLAKQEEASESGLEALFQSKMKALKHQQSSLMTTRTALPRIRDQLQTAVRRLEVTQGSLSRELHSLGIFLQRLAHLALAPAAEAANLARNLPEKVAESEPPQRRPSSKEE